MNDGTQKIANALRDCIDEITEIKDGEMLVCGRKLAVQLLEKLEGYASVFENFEEPDLHVYPDKSEQLNDPVYMDRCENWNG